MRAACEVEEATIDYRELDKLLRSARCAISCTQVTRMVERRC